MSLYQFYAELAHTYVSTTHIHNLLHLILWFQRKWSVMPRIPLINDTIIVSRYKHFDADATISSLLKWIASTVSLDRRRWLLMWFVDNFIKMDDMSHGTLAYWYNKPSKFLLLHIFLLYSFLNWKVIMLRCPEIIWSQTMGHNVAAIGFIYSKQIIQVVSFFYLHT